MISDDKITISNEAMASAEVVAVIFVVAVWHVGGAEVAAARAGFCSAVHLRSPAFCECC